MSYLVWGDPPDRKVTEPRTYTATFRGRLVGKVHTFAGTHGWEVEDFIKAQDNTPYPGWPFTIDDYKKVVGHHVMQWVVREGIALPRPDHIVIEMNRLEAERVVENLRGSCDHMREELAVDPDPELRGILSDELVMVNRVINRLLEELA
ncbi:hypothetical protein ACQZ46_23840 [Agrobacterium salinitolerans]